MMWYGVVGGGSYWVEVGVTSGQTPSGCQGGVVFWADNGNGGGYNEHYPGITSSAGNWFNSAVIEQGVGSCSWNVLWFLNSWQNIGTSTGNCPGSGRYLSSGIEDTTQASSQLVQGETQTWERLDSSGTWQVNWPSVTFVNPSPPNVNGRTAPTLGPRRCSMRIGLNENLAGRGRCSMRIGHFIQLILSMAIIIMSGCSSSDRTDPPTIKTQAHLASASATVGLSTGTVTVADAGPVDGRAAQAALGSRTCRPSSELWHCRPLPSRAYRLRRQWLQWRGPTIRLPRRFLAAPSSTIMHLCTS